MCSWNLHRTLTTLHASYWLDGFVEMIIFFYIQMKDEMSETGGINLT